jgi:protein gp37
VAHTSIKKAAKIQAEAPDLIGAVKTGDLTLEKAYDEARKRERSRPKPEPEKPTQEFVILRTHEGAEVPYPKPKGKATFNPTNDHISWAAWSWNPVTGCLHGCQYCYARELANLPSYRASYPVGFTPLFHHERLDAPVNTPVPADATTDPRRKRVFVCSMADLYGKWVPEDWICAVHGAAIANPQWDYLFLTKFPSRYVDLDLPTTAWIGTSVDSQRRVTIAEHAFREISNVKVKWLSLEPLLEPLKFNDLSMFDWVVIGSQTRTVQPGDEVVEEFAPDFEWVARIVAQAREAGCGVYLKPNLMGETGPQSPGMRLPQEIPGSRKGKVKV